MRRKILKLSAGWVLCAAAWAACGGEKTVTHKELGVQISFPERLSVENQPAAIVAHEFNKGAPILTAFVSVEDLKEGDSLTSFFTLPGYRDLLKGKTLTDIGIVKLDGYSAIKLTVVSDGESEKHQSVFYYTVAGTRGYVIWFQTTVRAFDKDKVSKEIDAIVASFKIIKTK